MSWGIRVNMLGDGAWMWVCDSHTNEPIRFASREDAEANMKTTWRVAWIGGYALVEVLPELGGSR